MARNNVVSVDASDNYNDDKQRLTERHGHGPLYIQLGPACSQCAPHKFISHSQLLDS